MAERRRDHKGRVLKTGESQRKDLLYQYRYTDAWGKRHTVYSPDLNELREKEKELQLKKAAGLHYAEGRITVIELLERYMSLKRNLKLSTQDTYGYVVKYCANNPFGKKKISSVKMSDVQRFVLELHNEGKAYATIKLSLAVLKAAFDMACKEDVIHKNPVCFKLADIIYNDGKKRDALSTEQQEVFLNFLKENERLRRYYDLYVLFIESGMRVGEICGLTLQDIDFRNRKVNVERQLCSYRKGGIGTAPPKSEAGCRSVPMSNALYHCLERMVSARQVHCPERMIDGHIGFLLLNEKGMPMDGGYIRRIFTKCYEAFVKENPTIRMPVITPHTLRHTFCTNMINAGISVNNVQYMMGHSNASITLDVYTHSSFETASRQVREIMDAAGG